MKTLIECITILAALFAGQEATMGAQIQGGSAAYEETQRHMALATSQLQQKEFDAAVRSCKAIFAEQERAGVDSHKAHFLLAEIYLGQRDNNDAWDPSHREFAAGAFSLYRIRHKKELEASFGSLSSIPEANSPRVIEGIAWLFLANDPETVPALSITYCDAAENLLGAQAAAELVRGRNLLTLGRRADAEKQLRPLLEHSDKSISGLAVKLLRQDIKPGG